MAIEITPLGFKKPDGNELVKQGDNIIADNAQRDQELHQNTRTRLGVTEARIAGIGTGPGLSPDPDNPGLYFLATEAPITEDPTYPGLYNF